MRTMPSREKLGLYRARTLFGVRRGRPSAREKTKRYHDHCHYADDPYRPVGVTIYEPNGGYHRQHVERRERERNLPVTTPANG